MTTEIKEKIIEARLAGKGYNEIAEEFGVSRSWANNICIRANLPKQTRGKRKTNGKKCPKCHRGPFPEEYTYCPYCMADMRSEKEKVIESLQRAKDRLRVPFDDAASSINYAILKAIDYLKAN